MIIDDPAWIMVILKNYNHFILIIKWYHRFGRLEERKKTVYLLYFPFPFCCSIFLHSEYYLLTYYIFYLFIMFYCLTVLTKCQFHKDRFLFGLSTAVSSQLAHSKCSLNICWVAMLTWTKTEIGGGELEWVGEEGRIDLERLVLGAEVC